MAFRLDSLRAKAWVRRSFLAIVAVATFLLAVLATRPADAPAGAALSSITLLPESSDYEAEVSDEEFEEGEEWGEDEEEEEEFEEDDPPALASGCVLQTATARVVASSHRNTVRLSVRYSSSEPARTTVDYRLKGGEGSLQLRATKHYIFRKGQLSSFEHLGDRAMEKVRAARVFIVHIDPEATPPFCDRYSTLRLTVKHQTEAQTSWAEPRTGSQPLGG